MLLRIFFGERDRYGGRPLLRRDRPQGARTAARRRHRPARPDGLRPQFAQVHRANLLDISEDLPIVVEIVESEANIDRLLPELEPMMGSGLVTLEKVKVIRYGDGQGT